MDTSTKSFPTQVPAATTDGIFRTTASWMLRCTCPRSIPTNRSVFGLYNIADMGDTLTDLRELRLDVWLDVACLFKTRSDAQAACKNGKLSVNGQVAKPNRRLHVGDEIQIGRP